MGSADGSRRRPWAEFYLRHRRALTVYALSLTGNETDAQDLIQDVLLRMIQQDRPLRDAKTYVLRCLRNLAIDRRRARRPSAASVESDPAAFLADDSPDPARRESLECARRALRDLPADRREAIVLKLYAGLSFREIAQIVQRPLGTVTSTYTRGLDELRGILEPETPHVS